MEVDRKRKSQMLKLDLIKLVLAIFVFAIISSNAASQTRLTKALKFDEYNTAEAEDSIFERANRFAIQLKKFPTAKIYLIYYKSRKSDYPVKDGEYWAEETAYELNLKHKIPTERIVKVNGGFRELSSVEFWIVPKNGTPPTLTPTLNSIDSVSCPRIVVYARDYYFDNTEPLQFFANIQPQGQKLGGYEWEVSAGATIIQGQGTHQITVDASKTEDRRIVASVRLKGLPLECDDKAANVIEIGRYPKLIERFQLSNISLFKAIADSYAAVLSSHPEFNGYIIIYETRKGSRRFAPKFVEASKQYLIDRGIRADRLTIIDGGYREETIIEMWLIPPGASLPQIRPTVDREFIKKRTPKRTFLWGED